MKALVIPEANSNWEIRDVPTPNILDEEVLIKIKASGLCYSDIHMSRGEWGNEFPIIPGHEPAGVIVAVGKRVIGLK
ncbi:alcohol dehydrogenase, partial [Bacillus toyonensis]|uniref:alcohol dehydrogenase catalytic domain-containing protein n=4 Tax=Bacillaceae TaxID=186817 RepID=UPI000C03425E